MKRYEIQGAGGVDALAVRDVAPAQPGSGQIKVRVRASAINYRDLATIEDPVSRALALPRVPNSDCAGEVIAVADEVAEFAVGDRVASCFFQDWQEGPCTQRAMDSALGGVLDGVLAEEVILDAAGAVHVPAHLSDGEAATLPCAALTAWNSVVVQGKVKAGDTVLLLGTGGVSIFALQFATLVGARTIITSSSDDKLKHARGLGACETINYRTHPQWQDEVLALTGGVGVDHTVEVGGAGTLERSVAATRVAGSIGMIGVLSGGQINPALVMRRSIRLQGIYVGSRAMFQAMNRAIDHHRLRPVIDSSYDFDDARSAYHAMRNAGHFGKLVIDVP